MKILSIETSCDETAISIVDAKGTLKNPKFKVLGNALFSQAKIHAKYGGVYPNLAKREHQKNLIPLLKTALKDSNLISNLKFPILNRKKENLIKKVLEREIELLEQFLKFIPKISIPKIDLIAVTQGPGLEPALWVGINFAKALEICWDIPVLPVNHMEGHFLSVLYQSNQKKLGEQIKYPALALLISGGHTELVFSKKPLDYKVIGKTRDDAVGETYDKVARLLSLPYPGGPPLSLLAEEGRKLNTKSTILKSKYPRPMINSGNYDFSFSGLKTAVLYSIKNKKLKLNDKRTLAKEFENAVIETLLSKTGRALKEFRPRTLVIAGGVISNSFIKNSFRQLLKNYPRAKLLTPTNELTTDNSVMIAIAGYINSNKKIFRKKGPIDARGNLSF